MTTITNLRRTGLGALLLVATLAGVTACSDDDPVATDAPTPSAPADETPEPVPPTPTTPPGPADDPSVLSVELADFSFGELPESVPAGTRIDVTNTSAAELHELVAVRLPDGEDRPIEALVPAELGPLFAAGPPAAVVLAEPGSATDIVAVGDGILHEPGRYLIICTIPSGVDPATYLEAAAASGGKPPQVPGGPPHFVHGMVGELVVTGDAS